MSSKEKAKEKFLLKDFLFNESKIENLAKEIKRVYPSFTSQQFVKEIISKFPELELKARITWIAESLKKYLPDDYKKAIAVILKALPKENDPNLSDGDFGDFIYAPYAEYVARYGCNQKDLSVSLNALYEITKRFSAENAIRFFINAFPKETLAELTKWSKDKNYHVRRLSSEGTRPKLPWSQKLIISHDVSVPILNNLFADKTRYVTRSVANHLNDISKIDPELVIDTLSQWEKEGKQSKEEMEFIKQHALRSLIKNGNSRALQLLGISCDVNVNVSNFKVPKEVEMNQALEFSFVIQATENAEIIVNYVLHFQNKSGQLKGRKVFKLRKISIAKNEKVIIKKQHVLKENMTTRKLYRGKHKIEIQINGKNLAQKYFMIK
jgi:3-methyladenine DNA glycosylase AlkC